MRSRMKRTTSIRGMLFFSGDWLDVEITKVSAQDTLLLVDVIECLFEAVVGLDA